MSIGTGPKSSSKKSTKNITTAKEVKETKSVAITVQFIRLLVFEQTLAKSRKEFLIY